jgi:predicted GNAT family acetyltransferase
MPADVRDAHDDTRYEVTVDGELAGFAAYRDVDGARVFTHTEVFDGFEGKGVGSALAKGALDDVRVSGRRLVALCPFIAAYLDRHDEYAELVDQVVDLRGQKAAAEAELAALGAEVKHQDSVFATLEVLKKEQDFLRGLIGTMLDEGQEARDQVDELRLESAALLNRKLTLERELISRQAEIDVLDKAILAKDRDRDDEPGVSAARAF